MAEGNFSISIAVEADMTAFRQQLRTELEAAQRGVTVPVRGAGPGAPSGIPTTPAGIAAAEQQAVREAFERANASAIVPPRTPRGPGAALAMANAAQLPADVAALRGELFGAAGPLPPPTGSPAWRAQQRNAARVERNWDLAALAAQRAEERAEISSRRRLERFDIQADRLRERGELDPPSLDDIAELGVAVPERERVRARARARRVPGSVMFGRGGGIGGLRSIAGIIGVTEIANAVEAFRGGESIAQFANTPQEAALARAQAREQAWSGLIGSTIAFGANLLDTPGAPQRVEREAREDLERRRMRDESRQMLFGAAADAAFRRGFATGGTTEGEFQRGRIQTISNIETLSRQARELQSMLDARTPIVTTTASAGVGGMGTTVTTGGQLVMADPATRRATEEKIFALRQQQQNALEDLDFQRQAYERQRGDFFQQSQQSVGMSNLIMQGASSRVLQRQQLENAFARQRAQALFQFGPAAAAAVDAEADALLGSRTGGQFFGPQNQIGAARVGGALSFQEAREDANINFRLRADAQQTRLLAANQPVQAQLAAAFNNATLQTINARTVGNLPQLQDAIREQLTANIGGILAGAARTFGGQMQALGGERNVLQALLNRDPLGATIAGIRGQRDAALRDAESDLPGLRQIRQFGIRTNATLRERLARQQAADERFETGDVLDDEIRQSRLRIAGRPLDAALDKIVSETGRDARALEARGESELAVKRRSLGEQQVREFRADYYRSFEFEEVAGGRIAASRRGDYAGMEKKFKDAEDRIGKKGKDEGEYGGGKGPMTAEQGATMLQILAQILAKHFRGKTGP